MTDKVDTFNNYAVSFWLDKNMQSLQNFSFNCLHHYNLDIRSKSLKIVWMGKAKQILP